MKWKAIHLYIYDITFHNVFLAEYLKPEIKRLEAEQLLTQYFYIVYWQGGNHIRFRYKSVKESEVEKRIRNCYKKFLEIYQPVYVLDEESYYRLYSNNKENVRDIFLIPDRTAKNMEYEPEYERYGGCESMVYNENLFSLSSKYALQIRAEAAGSMIKRIVGALDMFTLAIKYVKDKENFLCLYRKYWSEFAPQKGKQSISSEELSNKYKKRYTELMKHTDTCYAQWEQDIKSEMDMACACQTTYQNKEIAYSMMLASQIHMTNNRLGIMPQMEAMLADVLYTCGRC